MADRIWEDCRNKFLSFVEEETESSSKAQVGENSNESTTANSSNDAVYVSEEDRYLNKILSAEGLNFNTLSVKLEMFVCEDYWKSLDI